MYLHAGAFRIWQVERALGGERRFALINVWRPITAAPVQSNPLACCDATSARKEELVVFEIHYADRIGENYFAAGSDAHRWVYFPGMARDEALLIKQWDSAGDLARESAAQLQAADADGRKKQKVEGGGAPLSTFTLHSAFGDPTSAPDAPDRESIEVRCVVLY